MHDRAKLEALRARVAALSGAQQALLRQQLAAQGIAWEQVEPVAAEAPLTRPEHLPLSAAQAPLWVLHQLHPTLTAYHIAFAWTFDGALDDAALAGAWRAVVARHEALRTVFRQQADGTPYQFILDDPPCPLVIEALPGAAADWEAAVEARAQALAGEPFDLRAGPLFRILLLRRDPAHHVLVVVLHHLIADGWSRGLLMRELASCYRALAAGQPPALPALAAQYVEHVLAEQRWLASAEQKRARAYWQRQLAGLTPLELPADRSRPVDVGFAGGLHTRLLSRELSLALRPFARRQGASLFMVLLTAFHVLLHRHTGERDLAIGVPVAGRNDEQDAALIGYFVNTLVLRTQFAPAASSSFESWLTRLKASFADALEHQALPFSRVVEACGIDRRLARNPLFEIMFQVQGDGYQTQNAAAPAIDLPGLQMQQHWVALAETKFDLSWHVIEREEGLLLAIEYRTALFDAVRIARMSEHFERLLSAALAAPAAPLASLDLLWSMERARLLALASEPDAPLASTLPGSFAAAFAAQCARTPAAVAVKDSAGRALDYRELQRRVRVLAAALREQGVGPECIVGVCLPRSLDLLVALLGVLEAGGAWLPLDPTLPAARLAYMLQDARCALALGTAETASRLASADCRWLVVDAQDDNEDAPQNWPRPADDALAYVMYTSGSSGRPKGTLLTQAGLMHYLRCCLASYPMEAGDGSPVHMSIGFDATITSLLAPLLAGRAVHLLPEGEELAALATALAAGHGVVKLTPAHLAALPPLLPATLPKEGLPKAFVIGGEALTAQHVEFWRARYPGIALINEYGPTETVVGCCVHVVGDERGATIPIGRPLAGIALYVLDEALNLCPLGVPGELYIAGPTVARGYLGQPALSAERFLPNPFACKGGAHGTVMYRSGDRARWRADGLLEYLGRADLQLKLRGHRIEPGEIEVALCRHSAVAEAVVCLREIADRPRLVAYYVADTALGEDAAAELRGHLARTLPAYMLPDHFVPLARLPLTHNGKIDRAALPVPQPATATAQRPASTAREHALLEIWQQILGREGLSIDDNFFELGGDSISGMQIVALARQRGLVLSPAQLFEHQTIAGQALVASELPPDDDAEADTAGGVAPLSPVQWEFLAGATAPHHFNQGVLLRVQPGLAAEPLRQALQLLPGRHAALRLRFTQTEADWQQHYTEEPVRVPLQEIDLSSATGDFAQALDAALAPLQAGFDLAAGPLFAAALVRGGEQGDRLLLTAHHLIVDGVSWRVLLQDLARVHADVLHGRDCAPPPPSASYGAWTRRLAARGAEIAKERAYWLDACRPGVALPCDAAAQGAPRVAEAAEHRCSLEVRETTLLLAASTATSAPAALHLLLTALCHTLKQWSGSGALSVDLESHGRLGWNDGLDLSGSVGWFTAVHPLRVELPAGAPADQLAAVGAALARVPEQGVGYGLLRMQGDERTRDALRSPAELCFNYLGQWRPDGDGEWLVGLAPEALSSWVSPQGLRRHPLDVIAWVAEGRLELLWRYDTRRHRAQTIERLAQRYLAALASLLAVTVAAQGESAASVSTPRAAGLSAPGVERLLAKVRARHER